MLYLIQTASISLIQLPTISIGKQPVALYTSDLCVQHDPGPLPPEQPARLERLLSEMRTRWVPEFGEQWLQVREPRVDVTDEQVLRVHTRDHLNQVKRAFAGSQLLGRLELDTDTFVSSGSAKAAKRAAGLVVAAVDDVCGARKSKSEPRRAFAMVRPPGHHAESDGPQGFCLWNNIMIGAAHAQAAHGVGRVAVVDFDVHHGNGGEDIAWDDPSRLYVSSHETPLYPGTGETRGKDGGYRNVVNAPLPANAGSRAFRSAWSDLLLPAVRSFKPEVIFISAGFDAHKDDPLANVNLNDEDFAWVTRELCAMGKPIVSALEGGYNVDVLPGSVKAHIKALMNA